MKICERGNRMNKKYNIYRFGEEDSPYLLLGFEVGVSEEAMIEGMRDAMGDASLNMNDDEMEDCDIISQWHLVGELDVPYCLTDKESEDKERIARSVKTPPQPVHIEGQSK